MTEKKACPLGTVDDGSKKKFGVDSAIAFFSGKDFKKFKRVENFNSFNKDYISLNKNQVNEFLSAFFEELAKKRIKESFSRDKLIIQAVNQTDELDSIINKIFERLFEWFIIFFPEAALRSESVDKFAKLVTIGFDREKIAKKLNISSKSMGTELIGQDLTILKKNVEEYLNLIKIQEENKKYIEQLVREIAPNLSEVATPALGAKLIRNAGGLENLANLPSSSIQVMGAEKSLFMHLTSHTKPPKHGIILQHPMLSSAPRQHRGKIARTLASKISIAARTDFYSKGKVEVAKKLNKQLKDRLSRVMKQ